MTNFRTAETVSPGHPDKIADLISDHVLTNALKTNKKSKVAVETFLTGTKEGGLVVVGGEISDIAEITDDKVNAIVKDALSKTIKTSFEDFDLDNLNIMNVSIRIMSTYLTFLSTSELTMTYQFLHPSTFQPPVDTAHLYIALSPVMRFYRW